MSIKSGLNVHFLMLMVSMIWGKRFMWAEWQLGFDNGAGSGSIDGILSSQEIVHREGACSGPIGTVKVEIQS